MFGTLLAFVPKIVFKTNNNVNPQCLPFANEFSISTLNIWVWWIRVFTQKKNLWKTWYHLRDVNCVENQSFIMCFHVIFMHFHLCLRMKNFVQYILDFLCFHAWELEGFLCFHSCNLLVFNTSDHIILNGKLYLQPLSLFIYFWVVWSFAIVV
jgi:hypothetical protein